MTPTGRTLNLLRRNGWLAEPVERWLPRIDRKRDLFRVADVLAVHPIRREFLLVQATTAAHVNDRLARVRARPELKAWLAAGGQFEVWGWEQHGGRWRCRRTAVRLEDLAGAVLTVSARRRRARRPRQPELFDTLQG